jgi:hypothetical protein
MTSAEFLKGPLCLRNVINFISQKLFIFWYLVTVFKIILIVHIHELPFALTAIGIIIMNKYFVWKTKYYFVFILLPV